jgi:hypothetical protein
MDLSQRKELFSNAYLRAVAAVAGFALAKPEVDDDSIDWIIAARGAGSLLRRPRVEVQLKCTAQDLRQEEHLHFPLDIKNYNDLRETNLLVPRILIVVLVPEQLEDWLIQSETEMALRHCGYWVSLRGRAATSNRETVTVLVPRSQMLTPEALRGILERIGSGGVP